MAFQELATRIAHRNTGRYSNDPVADRIMVRIAADENLHMVFYRDMLKAALKSGKTIADVAQANNVPVANVIAAIVADRQSHIAQAVADGKLTQAQADEKLEYLTAKVTESVSNLPRNGSNGGGGRGNTGGNTGRVRETAPAAPSSSGVTGQPSNTGRSQAPAEQPTASAANSTTAAATAVPPSGNVGGGRGGNTGGGRGGNTGGGRGGNGRP